MVSVRAWRSSARSSERRAVPDPNGAYARNGQERFASAWREARALVRARRGRPAPGFVLMLVGRAANLVLPANSGFLVGGVFGKRPLDPLGILAAAAGRGGRGL